MSEFSQDITPEDVIDTDDPDPATLLRIFNRERKGRGKNDERAMAFIIALLKRQWRP